MSSYSLSATPDLSNHVLSLLSREDLDLIAELVVQSGSLKDLADIYGVSYPTIRSRLDRVIARIKQAKTGRPSNPLTEFLAQLVERGELSASAARSIRELARKSQEGKILRES